MKLILASRGRHTGKISKGLSKALSILIIFHGLAVPGWVGYLFYKSWDQAIIARKHITMSERIRIPENPKTGIIWFGTLALGNEKWNEEQITASPNQQILVHQIWETVHGIRTTRFPNGVPDTIFPPYNPLEDPQAKAQKVIDPESNEALRKNPGDIFR